MLDKLNKGSHADKLTYEVRNCSLIEEHLEPIFCVYPSAGKGKKEDQEMICQIFNFVDVVGGKYDNVEQGPPPWIGRGETQTAHHTEYYG